MRKQRVTVANFELDATRQSKSREIVQKLFAIARKYLCGLKLIELRILKLSNVPNREYFVKFETIVPDPMSCDDELRTFVTQLIKPWTKEWLFSAHHTSMQRLVIVLHKISLALVFILLSLQNLREISHFLGFSGYLRTHICVKYERVIALVMEEIWWLNERNKLVQAVECDLLAVVGDCCCQCRGDPRNSGNHFGSSFTETIAIKLLDQNSKQ